MDARGPNWVHSSTQVRWPQHHISVSRLYLRSSLWRWRKQVAQTFPEWGGRGEPLVVPVLLTGQLAVMPL